MGFFKKSSKPEKSLFNNIGVSGECILWGLTIWYIARIRVFMRQTEEEFLRKELKSWLIFLGKKLKKKRWLSFEG